MEITEKVKSRWTRSFFTALNTKGDAEKYTCDICQRDFASRSTLTLHSQVHVLERKFKCEPCQVSFQSQGHLQKHLRSSSHEIRVEMTQAFGIPTSDNPRPYGCAECDTAFRKHGHLAKHLRSKSHITKLESHGLIPMGMYAALEKGGQELKDKLVTTNCEQSLHSLRLIAMHLFNQQPLPNDLSGSSFVPEAAPAAALGSQARDKPVAPMHHHQPSESQASTSVHQHGQAMAPSALSLFTSTLIPPHLQTQQHVQQLHQQSPLLHLQTVGPTSAHMLMSNQQLPGQVAPSCHPHQMHRTQHQPQQQQQQQHQQQQHSLGMPITSGNRQMANLVSHQSLQSHSAQQLSLDYSLLPQALKPNAASLPTEMKVPAACQQYSQLNMNSDFGQHQLQLNYHHNNHSNQLPLSQQQQQQAPMITPFTGYNSISYSSQMPISMPVSSSSSISFEAQNAPGCQSGSTGLSYSRP